jgi:hypothetical protein
MVIKLFVQQQEVKRGRDVAPPICDQRPLSL